MGIFQVLKLKFYFRFQDQLITNDYEPRFFQLAVEEAFMAENGFTEKLIEDINLAAGNSTGPDASFRGFQGTAFSTDQGYEPQASG